MLYMRASLRSLLRDAPAYARSDEMRMPRDELQQQRRCLIQRDAATRRARYTITLCERALRASALPAAARAYRCATMARYCAAICYARALALRCDHMLRYIATR